jgi:6-phosphogluconolactonase
MPTAIIVDSTEALAGELAGRFEVLAREAIESSGRVAVALTGGSVATMCYPRLAAARVDWPRVEVFFGDERRVSPTDPESNYGLAHALWLSRVPIRREAVHRMRGEAGDIGTAADEYEAELVRVLGDPPVLDVVILGVGPDGHVCSLFTGHPLLDDGERWVASLTDAPKPPPGRMTLTLATLLSARAIIVVATGDAKAEVVAAALQDESSELPVAIVAREAGEVMFLLDRAAAARLGM